MSPRYGDHSGHAERAPQRLHPSVRRFEPIARLAEEIEDAAAIEDVAAALEDARAARNALMAAVDAAQPVPLSVWADRLGIAHATAQRLRGGSWPSGDLLDRLDL